MLEYVGICWNMFVCLSVSMIILRNEGGINDMGDGGGIMAINMPPNNNMHPAPLPANAQKHRVQYIKPIR